MPDEPGKAEVCIDHHTRLAVFETQLKDIKDDTADIKKVINDGLSKDVIIIKQEVLTIKEEIKRPKGFGRLLNLLRL